MGKAVTYGIRDQRSIRDQRESLPIFKLKDQLVTAVEENQVCGRGEGGGCSGATGWKTLLLPKFLARAGMASLSSCVQLRTLPTAVYSTAFHSPTPHVLVQTLVVIGETGSGKTTQMTQYLAEVRVPGCARA